MSKQINRSNVRRRKRKRLVLLGMLFLTISLLLSFWTSAVKRITLSTSPVVSGNGNYSLPSPNGVGSMVQQLDAGSKEWKVTNSTTRAPGAFTSFSNASISSSPTPPLHPLDKIKVPFPIFIPSLPKCVYIS